ncbi:hypothetical protein V8B55DRAFT_1473560 [Mucor lusitanicus]|uniref:Uncharacterized protein n=2 Tax=Mucor circinelloides f. lusitanicus TaxID=29924 RepID=A0A162TVY5_MUCCL|nr:hypothetical protein FB192DRAFT_1342211 [Mucor lusitanicus]OAD07602.1 hypothetical protein MUCCIDRAFT_157871 [Mucor lusitanicus CBS 277.49]
MKRTAVRREADSRRSRAEQPAHTPHQPTPETKAVESHLPPQLLALYDKLHEEVEETNRISELSQNLSAYLRRLGKSIETASDSAESAEHIMQNWDRTFSIMGEMNKGREKESQTWVRLKDNENGR